jgi:hypothetical protein
MDVNGLAGVGEIALSSTENKTVPTRLGRDRIGIIWRAVSAATRGFSARSAL